MSGSEMSIVKQVRKRRRIACIAAQEQAAGRVPKDAFDYSFFLYSDVTLRRRIAEAEMLVPELEDVVAEEVALAVAEVFGRLGSMEAFAEDVAAKLRDRLKVDTGRDDEPVRTKVSQAVIRRQVVSASRTYGAYLAEKAVFTGVNRFFERLHLEYAEAKVADDRVPAFMRISQEDRKDAVDDIALRVAVLEPRPKRERPVSDGEPVPGGRGGTLVPRRKSA